MVNWQGLIILQDIFKLVGLPHEFKHLVEIVHYLNAVDQLSAHFTQTV